MRDWKTLKRKLFFDKLKYQLAWLWRSYAKKVTNIRSLYIGMSLYTHRNHVIHPFVL